MNTSKSTPSSSSTSNGSSNESLQLAFDSARFALDKKAEHVKILDLRTLSGFTDYFVLCSGMSDRQVQAISDSVLSQAKKERGVRASNFEGYSEGRWVLIDFGSVVVHVFHDAIREHFNLEELWKHAPRVQVPAEAYGVSASNAASTTPTTGTAARA